MTRKTTLNQTHRDLGAKMVDFGGWDMPLNYGSQIEEHHQVRRDAGMFDVSHMTVVDIEGADARAYLRRLLCNAIDKLKTPGKALYACMLNAQGGVIDDLIVYLRGEGRYRVVVNAATRDKDLAWMTAQADGFAVTLAERRDLAIIAVQGPTARAKAASLLPAVQAEAALALGRFAAAELGDWFVARTGYTGEDGFELIVPDAQVVDTWNRLLQAGVKPAGLGARDTLRLEAGMSLYGQDMDESVSPLEAGLAWTVSFDADRDFIGRAALEAQKAAGVPRQMIGLVMDEKGVLRHGQTLQSAAGAGEILSGTFSPTIGKAIALARVPAGDVGATVQVDIRGRLVPLRVVRYPFVREGRIQPGVLPDA